MKKPPAFRPFSPSDLDPCMAIFDSNCPKFFAVRERDEFLKYLQDERWPYFVVADGRGPLLACGGFVLENAVGQLAWGMVRSDLHKQGLGTFLFRQRLDAMRKAGARSVIMDTSQHSLSFYQSLGFEVVRKTIDGYAPGLDRFDLRLTLPKEWIPY